MKDHIIFDTTNASTIIDSDSVGAFVRANDGTLITKHSISESTKAGLINQGLVFQSILAGTVGNSYTFKIVDTGGSGPMTFTEVAGAIEVDLAGTTPTPAQVAALLAGSAFAAVSVGIGAPANVIAFTPALPFSGGENTNFHKHLDVYSATADGFGNPISSTGGALDVNLKSSAVTFTANVDLNGIYNLTTNPVPDNVGIIAFDRATTPNLTNEKFTPTGGLAGLSAVTANTMHGLDVNASLMALNGSGSMDALKSTTNALWVNVQNSTLTVSDAALANTLVLATPTILSVANTAQSVVTSAIADRKYLWIYNYDNNKIFIGGAGVSAADGFPISPGSYMELRAGASSNVRFVGSSGKLPEIRVLEAN